MNGNAILRLGALLCFVLAAFDVSLAGFNLIPVGLAAWVGSTFA